MKIVVLEADSVGTDVSFKLLEEFGEVVLYNSTPNEKVAERIADADIVCANKCILNEKSLEKANNLKLIAEAATGYNNIDTKYCNMRGIAVANVSGYSTEAVAQHTFALLLALNNKLAYYSDYVNSGEYSKQESFCNISNVFHDLSGKTMGIIGLGNIGRRVAEIAKAFGMKVIYHSVSGNKQDVDYPMVDLSELLLQSDVVSVHVPLNEKTRGLIDKAAFEKMKKTAILINVARGPVVNENDLLDALNNGDIMAAGIDVYEKEPLSDESPLLYIKDKNKLLLTPHQAWGSYEARARLVMEISDNIREFLKGNKRNRIV